MSTTALDGTLTIGVARRDISPPKPELLKPTGMDRREPTRGVLDALVCEAMAVEVSGERAFIITSDLRTIDHAWVVEARETVGRRLDCDPRRVLFSSVHNHCSSPAVADDSPEAAAALAEANRKIVDAFIAACVEADADRRPAEIAFARAHLAEPVGENRRLRLSNGTCVNAWHGGGGFCPPGRKVVGPGGPHSTETRILCAREVGADRPFAALVSYPSHPHLSAIPHFSGEFPGAARREIERRLPGLTVLHANYTGGDIDIHCVHPAPPGGTDAEVRWFQESNRLVARRFADAVAPAIEACDDYGRPATLRHAYWSRGEDDPGNSRLTIINVLTLGDVGVASIPGELFLALGRQAEARSPLPKLLMMGYNGSVGGYQPPPLAFEQGSYEVMRGYATSETDLLQARPGRKVRRALKDSGQQVVDRVLTMLADLGADRGQ